MFKTDYNEGPVVSTAGHFETMVPALTDKSLMLFGKFQGYELANVPASYLLWIYDNLTLRDDLRAYIKDNMDALKMEKKRADKDAFR